MLSFTWRAGQKLSFMNKSLAEKSNVPTINLSGVQHVALDMDGTIYRGGTLFEFTNPFLALLKQLGIGYTVLTNNSSKSVKDYIAHLSEMGIRATADQLYTSTNATIEFLREELPSVHRLFVLGTDSMSTEIFSAGFTLATDCATDEPDAHAGWIRYHVDLLAALSRCVVDQTRQAVYCVAP